MEIINASVMPQEENHTLCLRPELVVDLVVRFPFFRFDRFSKLFHLFDSSLLIGLYVGYTFKLKLRIIFFSLISKKDKIVLKRAAKTATQSI